MNTVKAIVVVIVSVICLHSASIGVLAAEAAKPAQSKPVATETAEPSAHGSAGMRVYVDPQTGQLVSQPVTSEQRAAAQATDALFVDNPNAIVEAVAVDGSRMLILNGQHEMAMTATVDATGKRHVQCMDKTDGGSGPHRHEAHTQPTAPEAEVR